MAGRTLQSAASAREAAASRKQATSNVAVSPTPTSTRGGPAVRRQDQRRADGGRRNPTRAMLHRSKPTSANRAIGSNEDTYGIGVIRDRRGRRDFDGSDFRDRRRRIKAGRDDDGLDAHAAKSRARGAPRPPLREVRCASHRPVKSVRPRTTGPGRILGLPSWQGPNLSQALAGSPRSRSSRRRRTNHPSGTIPEPRHSATIREWPRPGHLSRRRRARRRSASAAGST